MACLDPMTIVNPRYRPNKTNGGNPPVCEDPRLFRIQVPCGRCVECRRRRASDWRYRLLQEYKYANPRRFHFVTLTFSPESLSELRELVDCYDDDNVVVTRAVRLFLERYRRRYGKSLRHLFVTELGGKDGRIHVHGIVIDCKCGFWKRGRYYADIDTFSDVWSYGHVWFGWCNERSISYILKYIMKNDPLHPEFKPLLLVSPGIGRSYVEQPAIVSWHHSTPSGIYYCVTSSGHKVAMPRYYRLKLFSEAELLARQLAFLDDPPPLTFRGKRFDNPADYKAFVLNYYARSVEIGTSLRKNNVVLDANFDFY